MSDDSMNRRVYLLFLIMIPAAFARGGDNSVLADAAASSPWAWKRLPDLGEPAGLKGMYAGAAGDRMILAGGSNFSMPRSPGDAKRFSDRIMVAPARGDGMAHWSVVTTRLPRGLAEGASVCFADGVIGVGGLSKNGPVKDVFILRWNPTTGDVDRATLPDLPEAVASPAAVLWDGILYVAGGEGVAGLVRRLWALDLAVATAHPTEATWEERTAWPGPARTGATLHVLADGKRERLFLFGGRTIREAKVSGQDYLTDAYAYDRQSDRWDSVAPLPYPALLAGSVKLSARQAALLGGSDGHDLDRLKELGERYRIPNRIQTYDAAADEWTVRGEMPLGLAGAAVIALAEGWVVAGGEYSPGLRTPQVHMLTAVGAKPFPQAP